jgi:hypothetical protein
VVPGKPVVLLTIENAPPIGSGIACHMEKRILIHCTNPPPKTGHWSET